MHCTPSTGTSTSEVHVLILVVLPFATYAKLLCKNQYSSTVVRGPRMHTNTRFKRIVYFIYSTFHSNSQTVPLATPFSSLQSEGRGLRNAKSIGSKIHTVTPISRSNNHHTYHRIIPCITGYRHEFIKVVCRTMKWRMTRSALTMFTYLLPL